MNSFPSSNILTFVRLCQEYPDICINMSQISSMSVQVCQFTPNYIPENTHVEHRIFIWRVPYCTRKAIIGSLLPNFAQNALSLSHFNNFLIYWNRSLLGETVTPEILLSCWSLIILLLKYSSCSLLFNFGVCRSEWKSHFSPTILGARAWVIMNKIVHIEVLWAGLGGYFINGDWLENL